jgi:hypothetical protein
VKTEIFASIVANSGGGRGNAEMGIATTLNKVQDFSGK